MPNLVSFDNVGGVPCYYAGVNAAYGDLALCKKSRVRKLAPTFLDTLNGMVQELNWVCQGTLGELQAITSGGAWVPESKKRGPKDPHVRGVAFDLGGLHWKHYILTCLDVAEGYHKSGIDLDRYLVYLGAESVIRKWFGTVLGIHHDRHHWNHFHFQFGTDVGFWTTGFGATTRLRYFQEISTHVWQIPCGKPDGELGPKTKAAIKDVQRAAGVGPITDQKAWLQLLTLTALKALQLR
jgi:hypothetical protein